MLQWIRADDLGSDMWWQAKADLIDLNGDGLPESVSFDAGGMKRRVRDPALPPPRLMTSIANGRGATTNVAYASMHDTTAVEQHPEDHKASPHHQWVVKSLTIVDDFATAPSTTSYFYNSPRHHADDTGRYSFRGFDEITTTSPSGSKIVQRYSYAPDWSGRLAESLVLPAASEGTGEVRSIDRTTWEARQLFGGALTTYHPVVTEHLTCANGHTELGPNACTAATAPGYRRTTSTLTALSAQPGGLPVIWQETSSLLQSGTAPADGDRETITTYAVRSEPGSYRLRSLSTTRRHRVAGAMTTFAKIAKTWDADLRAALTDEEWFDDSDDHRAITRFVHDPATGNLLERWKPKQNAAGTTRTTYSYDNRQLFVATEINERGHQLDYTYEYGTGTKIQTDGPNVRSCTTSCPPADPLFPVKEQHKIRVDGLGRTIERWDTVSDDGNVYTLHQMATTSYVDAATATVPTSSTNRLRLEASPTSIWKQETTELDGHGRPIATIVRAQGSAPSDHITRYAYRADGTLQSVSVPDPTQNGAGTVTYSYGFDSLGRPTSMRRPDAAAAAGQSGVDIAYDGVQQTTTEVVGAAGGQVAVTRTINDRLGRLVEVREQTAAVPVTWAVTRYTYGPDDIVASVRDPEDVVTTLSHDFAGHRTQITRAGRTWKYSYDRNGNMIAEQVPGSTNPPVTDVLYTTSIAYDDLDRIESKVIAPRALSAADRALFVSGTETFTWDSGPNQKGHLRWWSAYAPDAPTPAMTIDLRNNNQGQRTITSHSLTIAGLPQRSRQVQQTYHLFGGVRSTSYGDTVGAGTATTKSETTYDARLLPSQMRLLRTGEPAQTLAVQTRNVAGLVTKRRTDTTGPMTFVESGWTYDQLGRVVDQTIRKGPGPTQVARQALTYFGNDDPKSLTHYLGTTGRQLDFSFDLRHQLASVASVTPGYFSATYRYGTAGRFTRATESQTIAPAPVGSDVKSRDVDYVYGGTDPEQVTALTHVGSGATYASYTYDAAGNQLRRAYPTTNESWDYVYDGRDQLRRATKKLGTAIQGSEEYWYDGDGKRIAIVRRDASGARTELIWFIGDTQAHYNASGTVTHVYSHLSLGTPVARVDRTSNTTTSLEYQFHGLANNTIAAVAHNGTINASFSYAPFGTLLEATNAGGVSNGTAAHQRRFNDKVHDALTGLSYYGERYYDRVLLGWTQGDPLYRFEPDAAWIEPRRALLYAFSLHGPLRYSDPDGRDPPAVAIFHLGARAANLAPHPIAKGLLLVGSAAVAATVAVATDPRGAVSAVMRPLTISELRALLAATAATTLANSRPKTEKTPDGDKEKGRDPWEGHPYKERGKPYEERLPEPYRPRGDGTEPDLPFGYPGGVDEMLECKSEQQGRRIDLKSMLTGRNIAPEPPNPIKADGRKRKPADADQDGTVTSEEEAAWMRSVQ